MKLKKSKFTYRWNIEGFAFLDQPSGKCIVSKTFSPAMDGKSASKWCLKLYPNGWKEECKDYMSIVLEPLAITRNLKVGCRLSVFNTKGTLIKATGFIYEYIQDGNKSTRSHGFAEFIKRESLMKENFYILCKISYIDKHLRVQQEADDAGVKVDDRAIAQDMKSLSDVVLRVDDIDLPVHKVLLAIKSPVFRAMFELDTRESRENVVNIVDFGVDIIREMLTYVYTSMAPNVETMAGGLLAVADKYDMLGLKKICERELTQKLCLNNFCDTFHLSELHNCHRLKEACTEYFYLNAVDICGSAEWKTFKQAHANIAVNLLDALFTPKAKVKQVQ